MDLSMVHKWLANTYTISQQKPKQALPLIKKVIE
jgi:hypothetical protein